MKQINDINRTLNFSFHGWNIIHDPKDPQFKFEELDYWYQIELVLWLRKYAFALSILYAVLVQIGTRLMKTRQPFDLRSCLAIWNFCLAIFSAISLWRGYAYITRYWFSTEDGPYRTVCFKDYITPQAVFWGLAFMYSKFVELGDTAFLILRKRPVSFLHWFHHMTMLFGSVFMAGELEPFLNVPVLLNSFVHMIMYSYFGLKALGFRLTKKSALIVTSLQLLQFILGNYYQVYTIILIARGIPCYRTTSSIILSLVCGFSYLALFLNFFYHAYLAEDPKKKTI